jgi:hypothetical protein
VHAADHLAPGAADAWKPRRTTASGICVGHLRRTSASDIWANASVAAVGLGSVALAQFLATINFAGFFYFTIAIVRTA